jgi:hypothetical protein
MNETRRLYFYFYFYFYLFILLYDGHTWKKKKVQTGPIIILCPLACLPGLLYPFLFSFAFIASPRLRRRLQFNSNTVKLKLQQFCIHHITSNTPKNTNKHKIIIKKKKKKCKYLWLYNTLNNNNDKKNNNSNKKEQKKKERKKERMFDLHYNFYAKKMFIIALIVDYYSV